MPLVKEMVELFWSAYRGRGVAKVPSTAQQETVQQTA